MFSFKLLISLYLRFLNQIVNQLNLIKIKKNDHFGLNL